jgi:flagellar hook-length control protein FliK
MTTLLSASLLQPTPPPSQGLKRAETADAHRGRPLAGTGFKDALESASRREDAQASRGTAGLRERGEVDSSRVSEHVSERTSAQASETESGSGAGLEPDDVPNEAGTGNAPDAETGEQPGDDARDSSGEAASSEPGRPTDDAGSGGGAPDRPTAEHAAGQAAAQHAAATSNAAGGHAAAEPAAPTAPVPAETGDVRRTDGVEQNVRAGQPESAVSQVAKPVNDQPARSDAVIAAPQASTPTGAAAVTTSADATTATSSAGTPRVAQVTTAAPSENAAPAQPVQTTETGPANDTARRESSDTPRDDARRETPQPPRVQVEMGQPRTAAVGRAEIVEQAVRLENATGVSGAEVRMPAAPPTDAAQPAPKLGATIESLTRPIEVEVDGRVATRVARGLTAMVNQNGGSMAMRLDPPELGQLRVQMVVHQATVTAEFHASTTQAQAILEKHMAILRTALESQGLSVERLTVNGPSSANGHAATAGGDGGTAEQQAQGDRDAASGQSRGRRDGTGGEGGTSRAPEPTDFAALVDEFAAPPADEAHTEPNNGVAA